METLEGLIRRLVTSLNASELDYALTGALAASYYGVPRTTMDADVMVKISSSSSCADLVSALRKAELQVEENRIVEALKSGFKIATFADSKSPFAVDIILSSKKIDKRTGLILDLPTFYQAPEELVLAKLRMIKAPVPKERTGKDQDDIKAILRFTKINLGALKKRAQENNTAQILENISQHNPLKTVHRTIYRRLNS